MKFNDKEILEFTNDELKAASQKIKFMEMEIYAKRSSDEYKKKMGTRAIPEINPTFVALKNEIEKELEKRKI